MSYKVKIEQMADASITLTIFRNGKRYKQSLTPGQALDLAYKLMSFTSAQQDQPYYILDPEGVFEISKSELQP